MCAALVLLYNAVELSGLESCCPDTSENKKV